MQILVSGGQLQVVVEGRAIDLHRLRGTVEGGALIENYLVEGVADHDDRWGQLLKTGLTLYDSGRPYRPIGGQHP